jgi:uncharacterized protein (TIGR00251 family)
LAEALPFAAAAGGVRLAIRLQPKSSAERIIGLAADAEGGVALKVAVTAPPEAGKANDALIRLVARLLDLPRRDVTLMLGASDRRKLLHLAGDPAALLPRLQEALRPWLTHD